MDNASVGSHLEVRLAADIKQEAVNTFLQYLYEGFMMLTEENCKDVEKENLNFTKKYTDRKTINSNNCAKFEVNWPWDSQFTA
jgi:hypothetical protein